MLVNKDNPILRSSPDGIVTCQCCDSGLLEIKCPYQNSVRSKTAYGVAQYDKFHISIGQDKENNKSQKNLHHGIHRCKHILSLVMYGVVLSCSLKSHSVSYMIERIYFD